jgi:hypothetical protein
VNEPFAPIGLVADAKPPQRVAVRWGDCLAPALGRADARCARKELTAFCEGARALDILSHPVLVLEVRVDVKSR